MKLIPVEAVPKRRGKHRLQDLMEEFMRGDADVVKIDFSERDYKSAKVCRSCLGVAAKHSGYPIKVWLREGVVYLSKM
ncbi:hypothetical protein D1159_05990 [Pseudoflavonifractor sp. 524-17]|uniref:hypothetical protein n=1 Tax=Pseudoflavonifractor sp. 524-17 TaxID=2304577 RepID=UPI001379C5C0|nr:hypothetical protein [Pseudoflavonifractor sp. 524-17]NCE64149.1 hypothetical protein [Pseudoflavonifractor sp. 524-17]